jgi:hypothetical protein
MSLVAARVLRVRLATMDTAFYADQSKAVLGRDGEHLGNAEQAHGFSERELGRRNSP